MDVKRLIYGATLCLPLVTHAAFNGISDHSRANCINNESITWGLTKAHALAVVSFHTSDYMNRVGQYSKHRLQTIWEKTRRAAAVHWGKAKLLPDII